MPTGEARRVLVVGRGGIGAAIADHFVENGDVVLVTVRDLPAAPRSGARPTEVAAIDLLAPETVRRLRHVGPLDVVIVAAGVCLPADIDDEESESIWEHTVAVNLTGPFLVVRAVLPTLKPSGRVIMVSSVLGRTGRAGYSAYCASKHGLVGLVRALALELGQRRITVNAVAPGWVDTAMADADLARRAAALGTSQAVARFEAIRTVPVGSFAQPTDVASLVFWLASTAASSVTGQVLDMSGGEFIA